jgi:hypothetical protein
MVDSTLIVLIIVTGVWTLSGFYGLFEGIQNLIHVLQREEDRKRQSLNGRFVRLSKQAFRNATFWVVWFSLATLIGINTLLSRLGVVESMIVGFVNVIVLVGFNIAAALKLRSNRRDDDALWTEGRQVWSPEQREAYRNRKVD